MKLFSKKKTKIKKLDMLYTCLDECDVVILHEEKKLYKKTKTPKTKSI